MKITFDDGAVEQLYLLLSYFEGYTVHMNVGHPDEDQVIMDVNYDGPDGTLQIEYRDYKTYIDLRIPLSSVPVKAVAVTDELEIHVY